MKKYIKNDGFWFAIFLAAILLWPSRMWAQDTESVNTERDTLISAVKEIMKTTRYCALVTLDKTGHPQVRTMDPFEPDDDMVVWFGTNINSRKVGEIRNDSRVTLYYEAPGGSGYVVMQGMANLVDDPEITEKYWKKEWEAFYPDKNTSYALIRVIPKKLEIISYVHGITGSSKTWEVPHIEF